MAGLDPAIHVLLSVRRNKTWMPGKEASEAMPFFERLWPGMTVGDRHFDPVDIVTSTAASAGSVKRKRGR